MPLVAEKTDGVSFIVSACGPTVSAGEEAFHEELIEAGKSTGEADWALEEWDGERGDDPRPVLRRAKTPTLWMFGEHDAVIPTRACLFELARLREEGHVFAADHNLRTPCGDGVLLEPVIVAWLTKIGVLE
ncbi:MAG: hypothetical protein GY711_26920 [bacterium]|nr:hypothetical protein [bacterium]